jgi:Fe-S cluster biogenesis protein NfuA
MDKTAVEKVITERIKPALESHGGSIDLVDVADKKITVRLTGACGCCPHAQMTLKNGVEEILKEEFSDLEEVVAVD